MTSLIPGIFLIPSRRLRLDLHAFEVELEHADARSSDYTVTRAHHAARNSDSLARVRVGSELPQIAGTSRGLGDANTGLCLVGHCRLEVDADATRSEHADFLCDGVAITGGLALGLDSNTTEAGSGARVSRQLADVGGRCRRGNATTERDGDGSRV